MVAVPILSVGGGLNAERRKERKALALSEAH
jgi:hypothetical protein